MTEYLFNVQFTIQENEFREIDIYLVYPGKNHSVNQQENIRKKAFGIAARHARKIDPSRDYIPMRVTTEYILQ